MYRVMLVDDEYMIHLSLKKLILSMENKFLAAGSAEDGKEALQLLDSVSPHIVITDICMPEMDGLEFIKSAKEKFPSIIFIILSGFSDFEYAQKAIRYGVTDFLLKPIVPEQFIKTFDQIYTKLKEDERAFSQQNDWVLTLETYKKQLAEHIWNANETEASNLIESIFNHYQTKQQIPLSQFLENILFFLDKAMKKRMQNLSVKVPDHFHWSNKIEISLNQLKTIIDQMIKTIQSSRNLGSRQNILKAVQYMEEHFPYENLSLQDVSNFIGVSDAYFSRTFKEEMGIGFIKYLIDLRMKKAKELLGHTKIKTYEVAFHVGYSDYPHFSKTFKKTFGLTPSDYRRIKLS
ncbi:response regulator [Neobacillus sp. NPDC097160]|uniref:response regulator transcription factor n=1 Tax=Neobacillus sp. NPDC097160 TaxID=3364298 RepID=UPI0038079B30